MANLIEPILTRTRLCKNELILGWLTFCWALRALLFSSLCRRYVITILLLFSCTTQEYTKDRVICFCHYQSAKVIHSPAGGFCFLFLVACSSIFRFSFAFPAGLPLPLLAGLVVVFGCVSVFVTFSSFSSALRPPRLPRGGIIRTDQSANVPENEREIRLSVSVQGEEAGRKRLVVLVA